MDSNNEIKENLSEEIDLKSSIDDFLRELEEKEKDLNISEEMIIEVNEEDDAADNLPAFLITDLQVESPAPRKPHSPEIKNIESVSNPEPRLTESSQKVLELQNTITDLKRSLQTRQNDFDSYRKRIERERGDTFQNQISNLATQMLPVLDNMNRALDAASHFEGEQSSDFRQFFDGIALVNQQLNEVLAEMGVQPVPTVGEIFNPHFHDAVATEKTNQFPPNTITKELLRGYRIGDRLIRAAMVKVASPAE